MLNIKDIYSENGKRSKYLMNIDDILPDVLPQKKPVKEEVLPEIPEEEPGYVKELGSDILKAGVRGLIGIGEMTARIPRAFDVPGGLDRIRKLTDPVVEGARMLLNEPDLQYSEATEKSIIRRAITGGIEAVPQSALGMVAAAFGPLAWVGILGTYGSAQFSRHIDQALKEGKTYEESLPYALASAFIEGGGETIADILGARLLGIGNANRLIRGSSKNVKQLLTTTYGSYIKGVLKQMPIEASTEVGQNVGEALMQRLQGIEAPGLKEAAIESIGPAIVMTALFGAGSAGINKIQEKQIKTLLEDPRSDPKSRLQAAGYVYENLNRIDKEAKTTDAELWNRIASTAIAQGKPIDLSINLKEVNKAIEEKDKSDNFVTNLKNDLLNGRVSVEAVERIADKMPQYADDIRSIITDYKTKDPFGTNFKSNQAIENIGREVDEKLDYIILPQFERLQMDIETGKKRIGKIIPKAMPELAEKPAKEAAKILTEADKLYQRRELALRENPELGEIADKIEKNEPVDYWHLDEDQLKKLGYVLGREVEPQEAPKKVQDIAGKILLGETPDLSDLSSEERSILTKLTEKGQVETIEALAKVREKRKLPEKPVIIEGKPVKPEEKYIVKPSEKTVEELERAAPATGTFLEKATARLGGVIKKEEKAGPREIIHFEDITSVKAIRNANKKFDLINRRTGENVFPGREFNTPREAKEYFNKIKTEGKEREVRTAQAEEKAETPLEKITIDRKAVHAETGEAVTIKQDAKTALDEIEGQRTIYRNILECVSA